MTFWDMLLPESVTSTGSPPYTHTLSSLLLLYIALLAHSCLSLSLFSSHLHPPTAPPAVAVNPGTSHSWCVPFKFTYRDMRLTAPLAVRGGKNSNENQRSPDSILLRILSRNLSDRYASSTGVEHRELSLELSPPLLLAPLESLLHWQVPSPRSTWFTMTVTYTGKKNRYGGVFRFNVACMRKRVKAQL